MLSSTDDAPIPDDEDDKPDSIMLGAGDEDEDEEDDQSLLERIRKRMTRCIQAESENRKKGLAALKFKAGDQWPADIAAQRNTDQRPCLTINKIPTFVHQVTNDQRQNRPSINVSPVGDKGDKDVALMYRGMIRAIERDSSADIAYDTAFENAVSNGFGYIRLLTEYGDPKTFNQVLRISRVRNPFTVYLDCDHQEPDGADCKYGFITELVSRDEFETEWPDAQPVPFMLSGQGESYKNWVGKDEIRIAEYYEIVHKKRTLVALSNGHVGWKDELHEDAKAAIESGGLEVLNERESDETETKWYKVTALEVLERQTSVFKWIPIIPVIGNEIDIEGKVKLTGIIDAMMDAQRQYNYWSTSETELVALQPKAPFIMEEGQAEGHEQQWKNANRKNYPALFYKGTSLNGRPIPPPQRQPPPQIPAGIVNAKMGAAQDMIATSGIRFDATMNERMTDESGKAIRELRRSGDLGSFHYVDNLARALKHLGRIMIDAIPKVYDTKRTLTILRMDDTEETVTLDPSAPKPYQEMQGQHGKLKIFNPTMGKYGVTVTVGPSFATKRIEAAESMMAFAKALPNTAALIADLIAKNQDWPGAEEMASRLAKAVPPQLLTPDQKDVPPQMQAVLQNMDMQIKQLVQVNQKLMAALSDKQADRAQDQDKIDKDFEAKLMAIIQKAESDLGKKADQAIELEKIGKDFEAKVMAVLQKMEAVSSQREQKTEEVNGKLDWEVMKHFLGTVVEDNNRKHEDIAKRHEAERSDVTKRMEALEGAHGNLATALTGVSHDVKQVIKTIKKPRKSKLIRDARGVATHAVAEYEEDS